MANRFSDWKTFRQRWRQSSRLEKFLAWSVGLHLLAALVVVWVMTRPVSSQAEAATPAEEQVAREELP